MEKLRPELLLDQLFENVQLGIVMCENDGTIIKVNPEFEKIFGYSKKYCIGRKVDSLVAADDGKNDAEEVTRSVASGKRMVFEADRSDRFGTLKRVVVMASPIVVEDRQVGVYAFYRDITQQYIVEKELNKTRKLEAVNTLAGGIAHDFNNLLSVVIGNLDLLETYLPTNEEAKDALSQAKQAGIKAHLLTQKFLNLAGTSLGNLECIDLKDFFETLSADCPEEIRTILNIQLPEKLYPVEIDTYLFREAMLSIIKNGSEAMKGEGELVIHGECVEENSCSHLEFLQKKGSHILLEFRDSGKGITEKDLAKVFDPYFSTKQKSSVKGQGLDLTLAHSIITRHEGKMFIESEAGSGTVVKVYLPACQISDIS